MRSAISLDMIAYNPPGDHVNKARVYGGSGDVNAPVRSNLTAALTAYTELSVLNAGVTGPLQSASFVYLPHIAIRTVFDALLKDSEMEIQLLHSGFRGSMPSLFTT